MRTSKPFSTISYNSESFLKSKLDELVANGILDFWAFIVHAPEDDEHEKKIHKHVYFVPSSIMETKVIKEYLQEFDPKHPENPLTCITCKSSKFGDWYLYGLHDKAYLASKGHSRKHHYTREQFVVSEEEYFNDQICDVDRSKFVGLDRLNFAIDNGVSFADMARLGQVPVQLVMQYEYMYNLMLSSKTQRAGRTTHTPKPVATEDRAFLIDEETGEIIQNPFYKGNKGE